MRIHFDWDSAKAASNIAKHGVSFGEAMTVFRDPFSLSILDPDHVESEERWVTLGESSSGNLPVVVHTWDDLDPDRITARIISARRPSKTETRQYREESHQ